MKYLKIGKYELYAAAIIAFAVGLRIFLAAMGWPPTNSDEGTMGIMGLHIAYQGDHPDIFYGQTYMGTIEAYLAAFYFHLIGPSLFALRLSIITFITLFFICMYLLASLLFSKKLALVTLALLSLGSIPMLTRQMIATGGSSETLFFGSLTLLLATWLAFTYKRGLPLRTKLWRLAGYFCWGMAIGLGLWNDLVVLPSFAMAGLLLLVFCWRDAIWGGVGILLGTSIGIYPLVDYNIQQAKQGFDSLSVLLGLFRGSNTQAPHTLAGLIHGIKATILVSIPTASGSPFCPVLEIMPSQGDTSPHTLSCTLVHASWGMAYLAFLAIAIIFTMRMLWRIRSQTYTPERQQALVRHTSQLMILGSVVLSFAIYATSSGPQGWPGYHARYIIILLIATPVIIAPLWYGARMTKPYRVPFGQAIMLTSRTIIALTGLLFLIGTVIAFSEVPATQAANQQQSDLIQHLFAIGANHIYTDYWTCDNLAFESNERLICGVVDSNLQPSHNKGPHYYEIVSADPHAAYVFRQTDPIPALLLQKSTQYRRYLFDGYIIYQPL